MTQLLLPIHSIDEERFSNFYGDENQLLRNSIRKNFSHLTQPFFYIWGEKGTGKSHFLKACTNELLLDERPAIYVPLSKSCYFSPQVLENLEQKDIVCLDDLQSVTGDPDWEVAIFDLFNRIKACKRTLLIISADVSPHRIPVQLPDLASRLIWGETHQLANLNDTQVCKILQKTAHQRGIELPDETANFLLRRTGRDLKTLSRVLSELDKASLQAQRKLTIPFVKDVLAL